MKKEKILMWTFGILGAILAIYFIGMWLLLFLLFTPFILPPFLKD